MAWTFNVAKPEAIPAPKPKQGGDGEEEEGCPKKK